MMSSEGDGEEAQFSATPLQMYLLFYLTHEQSKQTRKEQHLDEQNLVANRPIIYVSGRDLITSLLFSRPVKLPTRIEEVYNQLNYLEEQGLLTQKKGVDLASSSFSITERGMLNVTLYLDGLPDKVEDAVQRYSPEYGPDIAVLFINLIDKVQEVDRAIKKLTLATEHSKANSVNFHIGGDYVMGDKAGGDIAGRDVMKAGGDIIINQDQIGHLKEIITELRTIKGEPELSEQKKEELEAEIRAIEGQVNSPKPKAPIIKLALTSASDIVKEVSSVVLAAAPLISRIALWLNGVQ